MGIAYKKGIVQISIILLGLLLFSSFASSFGDEFITASITLSPHNYRGATGYAFINISAKVSNDYQITNIWMHFDWMAPGVGVEYPFTQAWTDNPVYRQEPFKIPANVTLGDHSYYVVIYYNVIDYVLFGRDPVPLNITSSVLSFEVEDIPTLSVTCNAQPTTGNAPLNVYFTPTVTGGLYVYRYSWSWGDGTTSGGLPTPAGRLNHTYHSSGVYTVTLTVTDSSPTKKTAITTMTITVTAPPPTDNGGTPSDDTGTPSDDTDDSSHGGIPGFDFPIIVTAIVISIGMMAVFRKEENSSRKI